MANVLTAEELNKIAQQSGYTGGTFSSVGLPQSTAPTNVANVTPVPTTNLPETSPSTPSSSGVDGLISFYKSQFETAQKQQEDYQKQIEAQQKAQAEQTKPFLDKLLGSKSPAETRTEAQSATGIDPKQYFADEKAQIAEMETLSKAYNNTVAQRDQQIAELFGSGRGQTIDFLNNQQAQIIRNAAPELNRQSANINAKAATLQASQGMFAEARQFINQAVQDATADLKFTYDQFTLFYNINQDTIDRLDKKYQNAFSTATTAAESAWKLAVDQKTQVGDLMLKNPQAGILITDTIEQAYAKVGLSPQTETVSLTADMKNYNLALQTGFTGSFADFLGKSGNTVDGLATSLYLGEIGIGDVPSDSRNAVLSKYHEMQELASQSTATPAGAAEKQRTVILSPGSQYPKPDIGGFFSKLFGN